jgi:hypothetical protein
MTTPLPELTRCRHCGSIPKLSLHGADASGPNAFVFCGNGECTFTGFRMPSAAIASAAWESYHRRNIVNNQKGKS